MANALIIILLTLGAAGLYLAMPGGRVHAGRAALIILAGAGAALVAWTTPMFGERGRHAWFVLLALIGLIGAVRMITHTKPVYNALYFILVAISTAGLLLLMQATFVSFALLIIYAGAILVTYVFVIMLAQQSVGTSACDTRARGPFFGVVVGFFLLATLSLSPGGSMSFSTSDAGSGQAIGDVIAVGVPLLTQYIVGVEIAGVLLLAAMIGAIAIASRKASESEVGGGD